MAMTDEERHLLAIERLSRFRFGLRNQGTNNNDNRSFHEKLQHKYESGVARCPVDIGTARTGTKRRHDMTQLREYKMNGTIILGVDAGYGNFKTARTCFPTCIRRSEKEPAVSGDYLEFNGVYYTLEDGHKDFVADKIGDEDNYVLTLVAIAKELNARGLDKAKIHLAVGLPLKWVQTQREDFRKYMIQNKHVEFLYRRKKYVVDIEDCTVMPQCYAAIAENLKAFTGMNMVADIGNGTMNIMILNNGKASDNKSWTVKMGANQCFQKIRNLVSARLSKDLQPEIIENYLRFGDTMIGSTYGAVMEEAAKEYSEEIFAELREHGYDPELMKLYMMGGGAQIIERVGEYDRNTVTFDHDIRANAKGYEYFCYLKLRKQARESSRR